ncbi:MAG: hypothetical protein M1423_09850 [Acidobacteria bacterium]|nr:hypothetical protein [Acidobacteriota bacterium]
MEQKKRQRENGEDGQKPRVAGAPDPATPAAAVCDHRPGEPPGPESKPVSEVAELPQDLRQLVERMLTEGATFEDAQEAVNERGGPTVTLQAIQNCYRGNLELQKSRIHFQLERARELRESFVHPDSAEAQLASAAILTGLQSLTRKGAAMTLRECIHARLERENLMLKQDLLRMKVAREAEDQRLRRTKFHSELIKWQAAKVKLQQLRRQLMLEGKNKMLGPEAMEKIQEIYGLLRIPVVARDPERPEPPSGTPG